MDHAESAAVRDTRRWLERAVIGLNLCPFAKAVHVKGQVHYAVCESEDPREVLAALGFELDALAQADPSVRDTTLLILTRAFAEFLEFNAFLARAVRVLRRHGWEGTLQLASFHPHYEFAGSDPGDMANFTNRAPYPTLHLLRESSIARAVESFPEPEAIYEANMECMRRLGREGWDVLDVGRSS
jgi:hypothetical protein